MEKSNRIVVSIVTVSFNSENTIRQTIESVLNQTYDMIEYTLVDGLSSDKTISIAKEYSEMFDLRGFAYNIIHEKDNGIYEAMNKGISLSKGSLIGIINSDDWYELTAVEDIVELYNRTGFDLAFGNINIVKNDMQYFKKIAKDSKIPTTRTWNHPSSFVTKQTYDSLGSFKLNSIYADWDFFLRAKKANRKIMVLNKTIANFRIGGVSHLKSFSNFKMKLKCRYMSYRENGFSRIYFFESLFMELIKYFF